MKAWRWIAIALACASASVLAQDQRPTFSSRRDFVRLEVLVTDRNKPVLGLKTSDFQVKDSGVAQQVEFVSFDELPLNVVMVFDFSASMTAERLADLKAAGTAVVDQLRKDDRAALVSFNQGLLLGSDLTHDFPAVKAAIARGKASGHTSLVDASFTGLTISPPDTNGRRVMLVFSDGLDTSSWLRPADVMDAAGRTSVLVSGVGVGNLRVPFLKDLVELTGGDLLEQQSTRDLRSAFVRLLAGYRQRYVVGYSPTGVPQTGWHPVSVSVSTKGATVKVRAGYQGTNR